MKLYLVRHAQSKSNRGIHTGKETVLTSTGIEQAKRLGLSFGRKKIDKIYCSKMIRAIDTFKEIKPYVKRIPITYTKKINERSRGIYENKPDEYMKAFKKFKKISKVKHFESLFKPEGGENLDDLEKRAKKFLDFLNKNHSNDKILVVSHGLFLRVLINKMFNFHIREIQYFALHNAGISYFEIDKDCKVGKYEVDDYKHLLKYSSYKRELKFKP